MRGAEPIGEQADVEHADRARADRDRQQAHQARAQMGRCREEQDRALHHRKARDPDAASRISANDSGALADSANASTASRKSSEEPV